jgi:hypothetical protein
MSLVETAKALLKKGIALNDPDIIAMANELLGETPAPEPVKKKRGRPKKHMVAPKEDFSMDDISPVKQVIKRNGGGPEWTGNLWKDNGASGDIPADKLKTPKVALTPRERPKFELTDHECNRCGKSCQVKPHEKTAFFVCPACIKKMTPR